MAGRQSTPGLPWEGCEDTGQILSCHSLVGSYSISNISQKLYSLFFLALSSSEGRICNFWRFCNPKSLFLGNTNHQIVPGSWDSPNRFSAVNSFNTTLKIPKIPEIGYKRGERNFLGTPLTASLRCNLKEYSRKTCVVVLERIWLAWSGGWARIGSAAHQIIVMQHYKSC
eukprot:1182850-Prorocentrum_minimum.AAC.2